jgi:hypothetical protein
MPSLALLRPVRLCALAALAAGLALTALAGPASAGRSQESIMQDDQFLYTQGPEAQARALDLMKELGVDTVHTLLTWRGLAPEPDAARQPKGFKADDPRSYPSDRWHPLDDAIRGAQARGMRILLTPTGPAPRWAEACSDSEESRYTPGTCRPSASKFGAFVKAAARRYSGVYTDERDGSRLPRISRWSLWNEPNQGGWLSPQTKRVSGRTVVVAAAAYRSLVYAGARGIAGAGHHRSDQILLGETAPIGGNSSRSGPVPFYETLFCVDSRGRRLTGSVARAAGCRSRMPRLDVDGIAHHPYTRGAGDPLYKRQASSSITIAYTSRLRRLGNLGVKTRMLSRTVPSRIYFTEFGVSSDPPGKRYSVPLDTQAEWINQADYIAYRDSSVRSVAQYGLADDRSFGRDSFQTGLCFTPCYPKPAWDAYRLPLYVLDRRSSVSVFGQVRPGGTSSPSVQVQNRATEDAPWQTVATVEPGTNGYFLKTLPKREGSWRLAWTPTIGTTYFSREAVPRAK